MIRDHKAKSKIYKQYKRINEIMKALQYLEQEVIKMHKNYKT